MNNAGVSPRRFSYDLLNEITNGFSEKRKLGSGTYGIVYKGVHRDGKEIAVKMLHPMPGLDDEQFKMEFNNLTCLKHHPNIVRLVGYCDETRQELVEYKGSRVLAERKHRALCFEYMHNGSLHENLYDESSGHDWNTHYGIIKGICNGLKYLHKELKPPMYHLDLKPANVLLDENMIPKIADFGLSRLFGEEQTRITTSSIGTRGYLPPEYIERNVISNKFDVFSLGVIIIKIMTGDMGYFKSARMTSHEFIELVHANWSNRLHATPVYVLESCSAQIKICIEIALGCLEPDRHQRPSIGDIVNKLNDAESMIHKLSQLDQAEREIHKGPDENLQGFLGALDLLRSIEHFYSSNRSYSSSAGVLSRVNALLSKALVKMEGEFRKQLFESSKPVEPGYPFNCLPSRFWPSSDPSLPTNLDNSEVGVCNLPALIQPKFIPFLAKLAEHLVKAGRQQQCLEIYSEARASALESSLKNLGVEKLSKDEMQDMSWEVLESKIEDWILFMPIAVKFLFAGERQLCDHVLECFQSFSRDKCFAAITNNGLDALLSFANAIIVSKRSPEMFVLLDMYKIMCELQTEVDKIFAGESCSQLRKSAHRLTKCLAESAQKTFSDFEETIENDGTFSTPDGAVHPLTSYVIDYIKFFLACCNAFLMKVLVHQNLQKQLRKRDSELRESLRLAIAEVLLPAYKKFLKRFGPLLRNSKAPGKYIKHTREQLELLLGNLFEGNQGHPRIPMQYHAINTPRRLCRAFAWL